MALHPTTGTLTFLHKIMLGKITLCACTASWPGLLCLSSSVVCTLSSLAGQTEESVPSAIRVVIPY